VIDSISPFERSGRIARPANHRAAVMTTAAFAAIVIRIRTVNVYKFSLNFSKFSWYLLVSFYNCGIYITRRRPNYRNSKNQDDVPSTRNTWRSFVVETIERPERRLIKTIEFLSETTAERANKL
jgi:hypothetical protein